MRNIEFCSKADIQEYVTEQKDKIRHSITELSEIVELPTLSIIQVGDNPASNKYIKGKVADCKEVGIEALVVKYSEDISLQDFLEAVRTYGQECGVNGIIIQKPLPKHLEDHFDEIIRCIPRYKDIDGFRRDSLFHPCTSLGIINYIKRRMGDDFLTGKHCVIIGRSELVGRPLAKMMLDNNATVTVCHSKTEGLQRITNQADILVVATGKAKMINGSYVKQDAIVIDVGINVDKDGKLCGDCDREDILQVTPYCTPVPCGVGLLTRLSVLENMSSPKDSKRGCDPYIQNVIHTLEAVEGIIEWEYSLDYSIAIDEAVNIIKNNY